MTQLSIMFSFTSVNECIVHCCLFRVSNLRSFRSSIAVALMFFSPLVEAYCFEDTRLWTNRVRITHLSDYVEL